MDSRQEEEPQEQSPPWYIGIHDSGLMVPGDREDICAEGLRLAQIANYNMVTCPITTSNLYEKVRLELMSYYEQERHRETDQSPPIPVIEPLRPEDSVLIPHETITQVIAVSSSWVDLASPDNVIADISRQVFNLEVMYSAFCGSSQLLVPGPVLPDGTILMSGVPQFARALLEALSMSPYLQFHVMLPMVPIKTGGTSLLQTLPANKTAHISSAAAHMHAENTESQDMWAAWEAWDMIRTICKYSSRVSLALVLPKQAPSASIQARWFSEPVSLIVCPQSAFVPNKYKQPVFHKSQQSMLFRMMRLRTPPWILLNDISTVTSSKSIEASYSSSTSTREPTPAEAGAAEKQRHIQAVTTDPTPHLSYLRALQRKETPRPAIESFGAGYQDYLQMPLQPLADHLESVTYEVFEKDPIKYEWYERAIAYALHDWVDAKKRGSCPESEHGRIVIAVCGSGRGPLVTRALAAADAVGAPVDVWAVEKNPNAYVLLQRYNVEKWSGRVSVVKTDMRAWKGPISSDGAHYKVDIIVSELLGSFGDNELSPECLDGVQHILSNSGISIPSSYTALLTPIATPRLHADILNKMRSGTTERLFELPYVVMLHQLDFLSYTKDAHQKAQDSTGNDSPATDVEPAMALKTPVVLPCWSFDHPLSASSMAQSAVRKGSTAAGGGGGATGGDGANAHNTRFCRLEFPCPRRGVCHGFAGYFESVLYKSERQGSETNEDEDEDDWDEEDSKVELSTNPLTMERMSKDMISWFPIFFPVKTPVSFPDSSELVVSMWRQTDDRKVWYEWLIESYMITEKGQRTRLGVSELHSSRENGCLM